MSTNHEIAVLQEQMRQLTERVNELETCVDAHQSLLDKSWGGAFVVFLLGSFIGFVVALWSNISKLIGHS